LNSHLEAGKKEDSIVRKSVLISVVALFVAFALSAATVNISGTWTGKVPMKTQTLDQTFAFTQQGSALTGTVTTGKGTVPIQNGVVNGNAVSFTISLSINGAPTKLIYQGTVSGSQINFSHSREGGASRDFVAKKAGS
jgi:hypothetical protein